MLHGVQTNLNFFVLLLTVKPFLWSKSTLLTKLSCHQFRMSIEQWKYSHPTPTKEYFTTLPVLCCSRPDLFEVRGWHKTWIVEKPAQKNNTQRAICHLCGASKRKKKNITFTNSFLKPGLLFLLALLFEIKMNGCREDIVGGEKQWTNK